MIIQRYNDVAAEPVNEEGADKVTVRWVIAEKDGAPNFYMRVFEIEPGGHTPFHAHAWEHEMFVLKGEGCIVKEGTDVPLSPGMVVLVPSDEEHQMKNTGSEMFKVICLIPKE